MFYQQERQEGQYTTEAQCYGGIVVYCSRSSTVVPYSGMTQEEESAKQYYFDGHEEQEEDNDDGDLLYSSLSPIGISRTNNDVPSPHQYSV